MADLINLNKARKTRARAQRTAEVAQNRVLHGLPGAKRAAARAAREQEAARLKGHKLTGVVTTKSVDDTQ